MVAHVVLFTPKAAMTAAERDQFVATLERALRDIPQIVRATVGRRFLTGRPYDTLATTNYEFAAVIEFRSRDDLTAYLEHPAHDALGQQFYLHADRAVAYDFAMVDGRDVAQLLASHVGHLNESRPPIE